jgi:hypothetical protein
MMQGELTCQLKNIAELHAEADRLFDDSSVNTEGANTTRSRLSQIDQQAETVQLKLNERLQHVTEALTEVSAFSRDFCL